VDSSPEELARGAVERDRLLDREDPETRYLEDARHWADVYRELVSFKDEMLATTHERLVQSPPDVRSELERTDLVVLGAERERYRRRLDFWQRRQREMTGQDR
jgi:hypothetical protein